jgi:hypothetical protein
MAVFLARSECRQDRKGNWRWHVVTYDISNPDQWIEIDDQQMRQPCEKRAEVISLRPELYKRLLRPTEVSLALPTGDRITFIMHPNGVNVLRHETAKGEVLQQTCSGRCGRPPNETTVGPISCPSGSGFLDCTKKPPTLVCFPAKGGKLRARGKPRRQAKKAKG